MAPDGKAEVDEIKITLFAAGSRGDIQPCVVLARGLRAAGCRVTLAAPQDFAAFIQAHDVDYCPLRGDVQAIMAGDTGREFMESGSRNPLRSIRAVQTMIAPVVIEMALDAHAACRDADAMICLGAFGAFGRAIAGSLAFTGPIPPTASRPCTGRRPKS